MSLLAAVAPINAALNLATALIQSRGAAHQAKGADAFAKMLGDHIAPAAAEALRLRDANADGVLSPSEFSGGAKLFGILDADGNGQLTAGELSRGLESFLIHLNARTAAEKAFAFGDANSDGRLNASELGAGEADFARIDLNRDGYVTKADLMKAYVIQGRQASRPT